MFYLLFDVNPHLVFLLYKLSFGVWGKIYYWAYDVFTFKLCSKDVLTLGQLDAYAIAMNPVTGYICFMTR